MVVELLLEIIMLIVLQVASVSDAAGDVVGSNGDVRTVVDAVAGGGAGCVCAVTGDVFVLLFDGTGLPDLAIFQTELVS